MKPLRRLLTVIIFLLSAVAFSISVILLIPIQYLFTGRTNIAEIVTKTLYELMYIINQYK